MVGLEHKYTGGIEIQYSSAHVCEFRSKDLPIGGHSPQHIWYLGKVIEIIETARHRFHLNDETAAGCIKRLHTGVCESLSTESLDVQYA